MAKSGLMYIQIFFLFERDKEMLAGDAGQPNFFDPA